MLLNFEHLYLFIWLLVFHDLCFCSELQLFMSPDVMDDISMTVLLSKFDKNWAILVSIIHHLTYNKPRNAWSLNSKWLHMCTDPLWVQSLKNPYEVSFNLSSELGLLFFYFDCNTFYVSSFLVSVSVSLLVSSCLLMNTHQQETKGRIVGNEWQLILKEKKLRPCPSSSSIRFNMDSTRWLSEIQNLWVPEHSF